MDYSFKFRFTSKPMEIKVFLFCCFTFYVKLFYAQITKGLIVPKEVKFRPNFVVPMFLESGIQNFITNQW